MIPKFAYRCSRRLSCKFYNSRNAKLYVGRTKIDGDEQKFMEFCELFENMVHKLNKVQKIHRLKQALPGDAAKIICHYKLQESAYLIA